MALAEPRRLGRSAVGEFPQYLLDLRLVLNAETDQVGVPKLAHRAQRGMPALARPSVLVGGFVERIGGG